MPVVMAGCTRSTNRTSESPPCAPEHTQFAPAKQRACSAGRLGYDRAVIPLTRPLLGAEEEQAVAAVLRTGMLVQGAEVARFERAVGEHVRRAHAVAVVNGTAALELGLGALGIGPGARVLVPALTWPSPAHAVLACGAEPVLVDVDAAEWNSGPRQLEGALSPQPDAVIAIDQFGNPCRVQELLALLGDVPLIVDAACSLGSTIAGTPCGRLGVIACSSFHPRKVITTGEGGMCLTDDAALAERVRELRNHGQAAPARFARAAGNERMSELSAAVGVVQMTRLTTIVEQRRALAARYREGLADLPLRMQAAAPGATPNHQTLGVVLDPGLDRDALIARLAQRAVQAGLLSYALHRLPQLRDAAEVAARAGRSLQNAEAIAERGMCLPLFPTLTHAEQDQVIAALRESI
jgi:dTDP-4-amino-4,6-dideoxygalactose transaminase